MEVRKKAASDEILRVLFKMDREKSIQAFTFLLRDILDEERIPLSCDESLTIPTSKKGTRRERSIYRGISLILIITSP